MLSAGLNNFSMRFLLLSTVLLVGCAVPPGDPSFVAEKTPTAAALAGQTGGGSLEARLTEANRKNDERLLKGDWRAAKPAVGPAP